MTLLITSPAVPQPSDDKLIMPGVRIGKWTLEMTIKDLVRLNGPAQTLDEDDPDFVRRLYEFHWQKPGFSLTAIAFDGQKVDVLLFNALPIGPTVYKTDKGVGFLSSRQDVLRLYGPPTTAKAGRMLGRTNMIYNTIGIDFQVENDSVALVGVFRPITARSIWKF